MKRMRKPQILIIDDEAKFTQVVKAYLEQTGSYEILEEHKGARALESVRACQPDLILLDIILLDQDGPCHGSSHDSGSLACEKYPTVFHRFRPVASWWTEASP